MKRLVRKSFVSLLDGVGVLVSPPHHHFGNEDRERFVVLIYHRVTSLQKPDFVPAGISCRIAVFSEHLDVLKKHFSVLSLIDAFERIHEGRQLPPRTVVLTFDDCWRENMETVVEPLVQARLPATFFINVGDLDKEDLHPNHRFYYLAGQAGTAPLRRTLERMFPDAAVAFPPPHAHAGGLRRWTERAWGQMLVSEAGTSLLDTLEHDLKVPASRGLGREIYMRSEQVRTLPACGIEVGNHTMYHQQLSALMKKHSTPNLPAPSTRSAH